MQTPPVITSETGAPAFVTANTLEEEDHPSESRPYKQYCTTLLTLMKAEAILIGSRLQGDGDKEDFRLREGQSECEASGDQR